MLFPGNVFCLVGTGGNIVFMELGSAFFTFLSLCMRVCMCFGYLVS